MMHLLADAPTTIQTAYVVIAIISSIAGLLVGAGSGLLLAVRMGWTGGKWVGQIQGAIDSLTKAIGDIKEWILDIRDGKGMKCDEHGSALTRIDNTLKDHDCRLSRNEKDIHTLKGRLDERDVCLHQIEKRKT